MLLVLLLYLPWAVNIFLIVRDLTNVHYYYHAHTCTLQPGCLTPHSAPAPLPTQLSFNKSCKMHHLHHHTQLKYQLPASGEKISSFKILALANLDFRIKTTTRNYCTLSFKIWFGQECIYDLEFYQLQGPRVVTRPVHVSYSVQLQRYCHFSCTLGYFGVPMNHQTLACTTGSSVCIRDLSACIYTLGGPWLIVSFERLEPQ